MQQPLIRVSPRLLPCARAHPTWHPVGRMCVRRQEALVLQFVATCVAVCCDFCCSVYSQTYTRIEREY